MLKNVTPRLYQESIFSASAGKNTLVVLPTGLGKTLISLLLAAHRKTLYPSSKILVLAPTKPLADQHVSVFRENTTLPPEEFVLFTGATPANKRAQLYKTGSFFFATPQTIENDVLNGTFPLEDVSLLVVDEAHRAVGEYSYVYLAKEFQRRANYPRILALTASPGDSLDVITEVCANLSIEHVESRSVDNPDVKPYVQPLDIQWVYVELPESFKTVQKLLKEALAERTTLLKEAGVLHSLNPSKSELLKAQQHAQVLISRGNDTNSDVNSYQALSVLAEALKLSHGLDIFESQGTEQFLSYFSRLESEAAASTSKAVKRVVSDPNVKAALLHARTLKEQGTLHPKLQKLKELLPIGEKCIIFTQYRDSAVEIRRVLGTGEIFVGQAKKAGVGLSQKEQLGMLERFRNGEFNTLICTSVGEEGLDIPQVNKVIFYEPVPSAIRTIQRRGRTARNEKGSAIVLLAKGTRDETLRFVAKRKEERMNTILSTLSTTLRPTPILARQTTLHPAVSAGSELIITVDYREKKSTRVEALREEGITVQLATLESGDYAVGSRVGVELKTVEDFVDSLLDGRLFPQLSNLKKAYYRPILLIEGEQSLTSVRNVHPNAVRGLLASIIIDYAIPLLFTKNPQETASLLASIARRELGKENNYESYKKKGTTLSTQQETIITALPNIGLGTAKTLLSHYRTIERIATASIEELQTVEGIGPTLAKRIKTILSTKYEMGT